jgi:hypothetical protein
MTGTPSSFGTTTVHVTAADATNASNTATAAFTISIAPAPVRMVTTTLPGGRATQPYSAIGQATGGTGAYAWSISAGALPGGVSLDGATGALSGTATAAGTFVVDLTAADATDATNHAAASLTIHIGSAPIAVATTSLPHVRATQPYAATLFASGGSGSVSWTVDSGALPAGIALDPASGALTGTPPAPGTTAVVIRATETDDSTNTATALLAITVDPPPVQIAGAALAAGRLTIAYSDVAHASGGTGTYRWTIASGALPSGIALDAATGALAGTPSAAGVYTFTAAAADAADATNTAAAPFSIAIGSAPIHISTTTLPSGRERVAYSAGLSVAGGTAVWSAVAPLPSGLTLNALTGVLTGTPAAAGTYTVTFQATDATDATNTTTTALTLSIVPAIKITSPRTLPAATAGAAYSYTATFANAIGTTKWNLQGGTLPSGLSLNATTGVISGICTASGTYSFNARVKDSNTDDTLTLTLTVK